MNKLMHFIIAIYFCVTIIYMTHCYNDQFNNNTNYQSVIFKTQPRWDEHLDFNLIETMLLNEEIENCIPIKNYLQGLGKTCDFDNEVFLITFKNNLKAVFKPNEDQFAEIAAYKASQFLGQGLVPPTVLRSIANKSGSLQFFIESDIDLLKDHTHLNNLDPKTQSDIRLFYFIFGQWDLNVSNQIVQINNNKVYIALIDNAGMYNIQQAQYDDFPFVRVAYSDTRNDTYDEPFPFTQSIYLKQPTLQEIHNAFDDFLSYEKRIMMWERYQHQSITYCFWRNGLWIQFYKGHEWLTPNYTATYHSSTLNAYTKLNKEILKSIWSDALTMAEVNRVEQLIALILERRDQVLQTVDLFLDQNSHEQALKCLID